MDNFVAIDVETANYQPTSICAIGAVKVINGCITDRFYELVNPNPIGTSNDSVKKYTVYFHRTPTTNRVLRMFGQDFHQ